MRKTTRATWSAPLTTTMIIIALAALCGCANDAGANKPGAGNPGASGQNNESDEIVETGELIEFRCYPGYSDMNGGYHGECLKKDEGGEWIIESSNKESIEDPEITTVYSVDAKSEQEFEAFLKEKNVASLKNRMDSEDLASMNRFVVSLDEPVVTDTVRITITGAKKGEKYDDICMSEVLVYGP
ncbi:MAG: hypothetical protein K6G67_01035 [Lachnospiraceae bacterium]|nr:hypothetical protein [Lachnospiraceae bacterium]